ncbi:hypothetical protein BDV28DRAFT_24454 [Aspergillus coremiiformis]|uniref:Uncharacterized protein n=1 Tax=Aspergillus coremiiformis TaxID=138285 RepID=A0A5N6ZG75_9EURO|nr:hypothetical protein BDV28DRAFT_24454 [Aspergillus coremiiformis]
MLSVRNFTSHWQNTITCRLVVLTMTIWHAMTQRPSTHLYLHLSLRHNTSTSHQPRHTSSCLISPCTTLSASPSPVSVPQTTSLTKEHSNKTQTPQRAHQKDKNTKLSRPQHPHILIPQQNAAGARIQRLRDAVARAASVHNPHHPSRGGFPQGIDPS